MRAPIKRNWDIAFQKTQKIGEGKSIIARAEMINIFDNPNFLGPNTSWLPLPAGLDPRDSTYPFGKITGVGGFPRMLQFTVRFAF